MHRNAQLAFEQSLLRRLRALDVAPRRFLVACSGGVDSMVLLQALLRVRRTLQLSLEVAHVHHGPGNSRFRSRAWKLVRDFCVKNDLSFNSNSLDGRAASQKIRESEGGLRELRWHWLQKWQDELGVDAIVVAHHYQDLLETRLMRLIRGTGAIGLNGMSVWDQKRKILRPFLMVEKARIIEYAKAQKLEFLEDPSNNEDHAFRNWMRGWLKQLDQRHPNGTRNLARSLSGLVEQLGGSIGPVVSSQFETSTATLTESGIDRRLFLTTSRSLQRANLARYCYQMGIQNYTQGHIEELIKRLDARKKQFTFELLQCVWSVTPERIKASRSTGRV